MLIAAICTGNTCRSPMLERLLHKALEDQQIANTAVISAGVAAEDGNPASPHAITAMADYGINLQDHRSRNIEHLDLPRVHLFITMSQRHADLLHSLQVDPSRIIIAAADQGGVPDPFGGSLSDYQSTAKVLAQVAQECAQAAKNSL